MKMSRALKLVFYSSFSILFFSGLLYFLMDQFIRVQGPFGETTHPAQFWALRSHAIAGLWFLYLFGFLYGRHVKPGLRSKKRLPSGIFFLVPIAVLCLSVPALYYLSNETWKHYAALIHTYLGIALILPLLIHATWRAKITQKNTNDARAPQTSQREFLLGIKQLFGDTQQKP